MKKVLVCALAALFLMASCLTAFAAPTGYETTTAYETVGGVEMLKVTTTVTGAAANEMLTYLAYEGEAAATAIDDDDIVYIDQKSAVAGTPTVFTYYAAKTAANLTGVTVKSGTSDPAVIDPEVIDLPGRTITVKLEGQTDYIYTLPLEATTSTETTTLTIASGYEFADATVDGVSIADYVTAPSGAIIIEDNAALVDGAEVIITVDATVTVEAPEFAAGTEKGVSFVVGDVEKLTVFGQVDTKVADDSAEYGILITTDADLADFDLAAADGSTVIKYEALGKGTSGAFAVQLVNESAEFELTTAPHYARIYVKNSAGEDYSDIITIPAVAE